jgi:hypothetical protein
MIPAISADRAGAVVATPRGGRDARVAVYMAKASGGEAPPPGAGLKTVTLTVLGEAMSSAGIVAASCVVLTKAVVRAAPSHWTTEPATGTAVLL